MYYFSGFLLKVKRHCDRQKLLDLDVRFFSTHQGGFVYPSLLGGDKNWIAIRLASPYSPPTVKTRGRMPTRSATAPAAPNPQRRRSEFVVLDMPWTQPRRLSGMLV